MEISERLKKILKKNLIGLCEKCGGAIIKKRDGGSDCVLCSGMGDFFGNIDFKELMKEKNEETLKKKKKK